MCHISMKTCYEIWKNWIDCAIYMSIIIECHRETWIESIFNWFDHTCWNSKLIFLETAINIGYSCKLLTDEMEDIFTVDGELYEQVEEQLQQARDDITRTMKRFCADEGQMEVISRSNGSISLLPLQTTRNCAQSEDFGGFALIINGHSLVRLWFIYLFIYLFMISHFWVPLTQKSVANLTVK